MSLLQKIQKQIHKSETKIESLDKLPDHEKVKVLDYLSAVKDLHKHHESKPSIQ